MILTARFPIRCLWSLLILILVTVSAQADKKEKKVKKTKAREAAAAANADSDNDQTSDEKPATSPSDKPAEAPPTAAEKKPVSPDSAAASTTATVTRGPLKMEVTLAGNLEAVSMAEITLVPKQWAQLIVVEAVAAGTRVVPGDSLLKLDTKKLDDAIRDLELARPLAELDLRQASESYAVLEKSTPLDIELADRARKVAEQDFDLYQKVEGPLAKNSAEFALKSSQQNLEYVSEELKQLEKMYKADDLTEETEEIILKRSRNDVERARHFAEQGKSRHDRAMSVDLPRAAEQQKYSLQQALLMWERTRSSLPGSHLRQKLELEKKRLDLKKADDRLAELKHDRELLNVKTPVGGVVYYGRCQNGKWIGASTLAQKFRPGGAIVPHEPLFTIVSDAGWIVRSSAPEKNLADVQPGLVGRAKFTAYPQNALAVKVKEVANVPDAEGTYNVAFDLLAKPQQPLIAGMTCEIKLTTYFSAEALTVPTKAVFTDENADDQKFVYVAGPQGKPEKRLVVIGHSKGDVTEIDSGIASSDRVFLQKPTP